MEATSSNSESKINYEALEEINEIENHIFLKLKSGGSFILPKKKIENFGAVKNELFIIAKKNNLKENIELNWKWK